MPGLYFEEFEPGAVFEHSTRKTVTETDNVLFCAMTLNLAPLHRADLTAVAVHNVGRSFAPALHVVATLPKTRNGKIMRRAIRARHLGEPQADLSSLDPASPLEDIPICAERGEQR